MKKNKKVFYFLFFLGRNYSSPSFHDSDVIMSSTSHHLSTERHSTSRHSTDEDEIDEDVEDEEDVDVEQCSDSEENRDANSQSSKKVIYLNNIAIGSGSER